MGRENKKKPVLFESKDNCCGCAACYSICPSNAITMMEDMEGFLYPNINEALCIHCFKCIRVCVFKEDQEKNSIA